MSNDQKPSIGRIVHFHEEGGPYAAIVTAINPDGTVELATLGRNSLYYQHNIPFSGASEGKENSKGTWSWPPRA